MMSDLGEKVKISLERLKAFAPVEGYWLAFSGGKDSVTVKALADMAGVKYQAHMRWTSVDPPELLRFVRNEYNDVTIDIPRYRDGKQKTMWNLMMRYGMPPTRTMRYCCEELKESAGIGMLTITGVRWYESVNRKKNQGIVTIMDKKSSEFSDSEGFRQTKRGGIVLEYDNSESKRIVNQCYRTMNTSMNPIIDWTDADVWNFIRSENVPYCSLYDEGFDRLGCIGCPMAGSYRTKHFSRWPSYKLAYLHTFDKMIKTRIEKGKPYKHINTAEEYYHWWMEDGVLPGQVDMFDELED